MIVKRIAACSQAPAWYLPAQMLEVGSTGQSRAASGAAAACAGRARQGCHRDGAVLLLIVTVMLIPGLPEKLNRLRIFVSEMLICLCRSLFLQKSVSIAY